MLKETIKYEDFNEVEQEKDFYFNLSKPELAKVELGYVGGIEGHLKTIIESGNGRKIIEFFEDIVHDSYGVRSADGSGFLKNEELYQQFKGTGAYQQLLENLLDDPEYGLYFIRGIVPAKLRDEAERQIAAKEALEANQAPAQNTPNGFRPGAQTLPQSEIDRRARLAEVGQTLDTAHEAPVDASPVDAFPAAAPETRIFEGSAPLLPSESFEDTQPTDTPELQAAREAALQTEFDGSLPEDPLLPHEAGYAQGLTRRQARELGLL